MKHLRIQAKFRCWSKDGGHNYTPLGQGYYKTKPGKVFSDKSVQFQMLFCKSCGNQLEIISKAQTQGGATE